jgi:hypothetical protein
MEPKIASNLSTKQLSLVANVLLGSSVMFMIGAFAAKLFGLDPLVSYIAFAVAVLDFGIGMFLRLRATQQGA